MCVEIQRLERLAPTPAVGMGQQHVRAEADHGADGIRRPLQNGLVEIRGADEVPARRPERTIGEAYRRGHLTRRGQLLAVDRRSRRPREQHVAAGLIERSGEGIEQ
jgi:hypothetical protein